MSDDWRSRLREGRDGLRDDLRDTLRSEPRASREEQTVGALISDSVRKLVTAIVIAGGLIGVGAYFSGDEIEAPRYQVTVAPDGRIIRLRTDNGTLVVCDPAGRCGILQRRSDDLEDEPPPPLAEPKQEARPALPAPAQAPENQAAPAPAAQR